MSNVTWHRTSQKRFIGVVTDHMYFEEFIVRKGWFWWTVIAKYQAPVPGLIMGKFWTLAGAIEFVMKKEGE